MVLTAEQVGFFRENGYLPYGRVLSETELEALRQRSAAIARGQVDHVPPRYIQLEAAFRQSGDEETDRLDQVRKMTHLCYFDPLFAAVAHKEEIVDVIEGLMGPNIKLYCDQLMMKARFNGTVTDWHQDSVAWPQFAPQNHVSCWVALDDATVENGCMTVLPGSHKWGPIGREYRDQFSRQFGGATTGAGRIEGRLLYVPPRFELPPDWGQFNAPIAVGGLALHYLRAETIYLGTNSEEQRLMLECEKPPG